jgi:hypothetical protein
MCLAIYVASDGPLPEIPFVKAEPALHTSAPAKFADSKVRKWVTGKHLLEIRSDEGCGCKFIDDDPEPESHQEAQTALAGLTEYLQSAGDGLELLAWWLGDEKKPPRSLSLRITDIPNAPFQQSWDQPLLIRLQT